MKILCVILLAACPLLAQLGSPLGTVDVDFSRDLFALNAAIATKTDSVQKFKALLPLAGLFSGVGSSSSSRPAMREARAATSVGSLTPEGSLTTSFSAVDATIAPYFNNFSTGPVQYIPQQRPAADLTILQPVPPPDPQMVFLDGLGNTIVAVDTTTLTIVSQVVVPSTTGPFGMRPSSAGPATEAWVANGGSEVSVVNLSAQQLVTNIMTPSLPAATSAGIVFTPDGETAFEAVKYFSPDASGNNGALVIYNAAARTVASTFALKYGPAAIVIAPDGLTVYLLSTGGELTYYDVLSGTADLSVSTYPPGQNGGYNGFGPAFVHPDGTRLLWNINYLLIEFNINSRTVTQFNSGLPSTAAPGMSMSQDGGQVFFYDAAGDIVCMDTTTGNILLSANVGSPISVFGGPPLAQ
jgi:hypothetical protein